MPQPDYQRARFLTSAATLKQCPPDTGAEVAFAGRSNAGKSSALNRITQQKKLAKTSKTPGRTQLINFFELDDAHRLVDLPGYGYAKVPEAVKQRWQKTLSRYLEEREALRGLILLVDCRHPLTRLDHLILDWARHSQLPTHVLLTKADKLKRGAQQAALQSVKKLLAADKGLLSCQLFSSMTGLGLEQAYAQLDLWLYGDSP